MPTTLQPSRPRRLTWRQSAALVGLLVQVRFLISRMERISARLSEREDAADSAALLAGARVWVALHIRIAKLFQMPLPPNVAELRDLFGQGPGGSDDPEPPGRHIPTALRGSADIL